MILRYIMNLEENRFLVSKNGYEEYVFILGKGELLLGEIIIFKISSSLEKDIVMRNNR